RLVARAGPGVGRAVCVDNADAGAGCQEVMGRPRPEHSGANHNQSRPRRKTHDPKDSGTFRKISPRHNRCRQRAMPKRARPSLASPHGLLSSVFGLDEFPPGYQEIIESVLIGSDTIGIMPSGVGNSLSYELPALLLPGTTIVVSGNDATDELHNKTIEAVR